jgi:RNA polymerase sigma factor (sigma-70 family)
MNHDTDEQLAIQAQADGHGSKTEECLMQRYWELAYHIADEFTIRGAEREDKHASCIHALLKAIRKFQLGMGASFKTFAKRLMRNEMTELYREAHRVKEIPRSSLRSLDEPVSQDDGEVSLADIIAGEDESSVLAGLMAEVVAEEAKAAQWDKFKEAIDGVEDGIASRLRLSILAVGKMILQDFEFADLIDLMEPLSEQLVLLPMAPSRESDEAKLLAQKVFEVYAAILLAIISERTEGYDLNETADRVSMSLSDEFPGIAIDREIVALVMGAVRQEARAA